METELSWNSPLSLSLICAVVVQVLCQFFKVIYYSAKDGKLQFHYFVTAGGMPSAHSAFVTALTVSVALSAGAASEIFAVSCVFAAIVIYDSYRLRGTVERHSHTLIRLLKLLPQEQRIELPHMVGHSVSEILIGMVVGGGAAFGFHALVHSL